MNTEKFKNPPDKYLPYAFFFLNGEYTEDELIKNIKRLEEKGLSIGYVHERGAKGKQFLSNAFFDELKLILKNTKLPMGYCDERASMYGTSVLEYNVPYSQSLKWKEFYCESECEVPKCFCAVLCEIKNGKVVYDSIKEKKEGDKIKKGETAFVFDLYHAKSLSGSEIDYLSYETSDCIIENCYEKIKENVGEYFQKRLTGSFMDLEGDFGYKLAYSDLLKDTYEKMYNDSFIRNLILLFKEDDKGIWMKSRYRWYSAVAEVYNGFFEKLAKWHEDNNLLFTGHTWEENLYGQVMQVGDFFKIMKNFSLPGVDSLRLECFSPRDFMELKTISDKENRGFMCEALACAGFSLSASEIKRAINFMTAWGVTQTVFHGVHTDKRIDEIGFAPDISIENYFENFNIISDYVKRVSYVNSTTKMCADTVLLNPIDSVKALLGDYVLDEKNEFTGYIIEQRDMLKCDHGLEIREIEETYTKTIEKLVEKNIEFYVYDSKYFIEEDFFKKGIKNIIIPSMCIISKKILEKLAYLSENGINVCFTGKAPYASVEEGEYDSEVLEMVLNIKNIKDISLIKSDFKTTLSNLITSHRKKNNIHYFWTFNNDAQRTNGTVTINNIKGEVSILNCETGEEKEAFYVEKNGALEVSVKYEPYEAYYIMIKEEKSIILSDMKRNLDIYESEFEIDDFSKIILELKEVYHIAEVFVNGKSAGVRMWAPFNFDITPFVISGKNKLKIKVGGLLPPSLKNYGMRWQKGIHRQNTVESYKCGIFEKPILRII